jgi:DNA sulfur modification protein DndE
MAVDTIRIVESDRDVLLRLKRSTGIRNWNILCRWAFCMSLADQSQTSVDPRGQDSGVEMSWKVFGGVHADIYWALLAQRLKNDGIPRDEETMERYFYRHLHR